MDSDKKPSETKYKAARDDARRALIVAMRVMLERKCRCTTIRPIDLRYASRAADRGRPGARLLLAALRDFEQKTLYGARPDQWFDDFAAIEHHANTAIELWSQDAMNRDTTGAALTRIVLTQQDARIDADRRMGRASGGRLKSNQKTLEKLEQAERARVRGF